MHRLTTPIALLITASLAIGCGPDDGAIDEESSVDDGVVEDTASEDIDPEDTATEESWAPVEGTYILGSPIINPNGCDMTESNAPVDATVADLDTVGRSLSIAFPNTDPVTCLYEDDGSFVCSLSVTTVDMTPVGVSAVIRTEQDMSGSFTEDGLLRLSVAFDSACTSGSCSTVELVMGVDLPCSTAYTVNASLVEE